MQVLRSQEPDRPTNIVSLQVARRQKRHRHWGALLAEVRRDAGVTQKEVSDAFEHYTSQRVLTKELGLSLLSHLGKIKSVSTKQYGKWETNKAYPKFNQLLSLYLALTAGCGVEMTPEERDEFVDLAEQKIAGKQFQYREHLTPSDWEWLHEQLSRADGQDHQGYRPLALQDFQEWDTPSQEASENDRSTATEGAAEIRHILGRDEWMDQMLAYLKKTPKKKLIVIQGLTGVGKSTGLKLLSQRLKDDYKILPIFRLKPAADKTPQDYLDTFLAELLKDLFGPQSEAAKALPLQERISRVLKKLATATKPVMLLLDDLQVALREDGSLAPEWLSWFTAFLEAPHSCALFAASRHWSWPGRERSFVAESRMDALTPDLGAELFRRAGFEDVPEELLRQASQKCGGNPNLIELRAASLMRPRKSFSWDDGEDENELQEPAEAEGQDHIQRIKDFVDGHRHIFEESEIKADREAQALLRQVVGAHLSSNAMQLLETLSLSSTPLALPLLRLATSRVEFAFEELQKANFVDEGELRTKRAQLLPLVREAGWQKLIEEDRLGEVEQLLIKMYQQWLAKGTFRTRDHEREKGDVVADLATLLLKHKRLLDAAQLLIRFGWLAFNQGHSTRIARLAQQVMKDMDRQEASPEQECGGILLHYFLAPFQGKKTDDGKREADFRHIHDLILSGKVTLQPSVAVHITHQLMLIAMNELQFTEAQSLLNVCCSRLEHSHYGDTDLQASLFEKRAWLFGRWCEHADDQKDRQSERDYRERAIDYYSQCSKLLEIDLEAEKDSLSLSSTLIKKRQRLARVLNYLGYHLSRVGKHREALKALERSLDLQKQGFGEVDGLAPLYGDISQTYLALGQFQKALEFDVKAYTEAQRLYDTGYSFSKEEIWIYRVNRGCLYLRLGRLDIAEQLLREAEPHIHKRRKMYQVLVKNAIQEINEWYTANTSSKYQVDWRWVERYRRLASFDSYWWLSPTGPFDEEEQKQWDELFSQPLTDEIKEQLGTLLLQSRERELATAINERREPQLYYPSIDIDDVRGRINGLSRLQMEIDEHEPNAIVRHLYREIMNEGIGFLKLIEATYQRDSEHFWKYNLTLNPLPTAEEMKYALSRVRHYVIQGLLQGGEAEQVSQQIIQFIRDRLGLPFDTSYSEREAVELRDVVPLTSSQPQHLISPRTARLFFEDVLQKYEFTGWKVVTDPRASGPYIEQGLRHLYLPDRDLPVNQIKDYLAHELGVHAARCVAGERSAIGLLGIHTKNSLETEEGLATYVEIQVAQQTGRPHDETGIWFGTLATGLASGVITPAQTFSTLFTFFEQFVLLYRLLRRPDQDIHTAQKQAKRIALARCIRTFRGVPDLQKKGICYSKDAFYLKGLWKIEQAIKEDHTILHRLGIGVVALEQLSSLAEMEITPPSQSLQDLIHDPNLDSYILSFEGL